ncbi:uncharacterized protein LOC134705414 [Mytilus trossulus]|uniref:uncharacterized protein LOC134705414 n=1 Tax=Mytilus trossulus TaxID=6551 RepID=UPI00300616CE
MFEFSCHIFIRRRPFNMSRNLLSALLLVFVLFEASYGLTTTKKPHQNEMDNYRFYYDSMSHMLGMVNIYQHGITCYIMNLSQDEQQQVHTVDGKTRLELKMLTHLSSATTSMTLDALTQSSQRLGHACTKATNIYSMTI